jgi:hypothetical protein
MPQITSFRSNIMVFCTYCQTIWRGEGWCPILSDGLLESFCSTETLVTEFITPVFAKTSPKQGPKIRAQGSVSKKICRNKYKKKHLNFFMHTTSIAPNHGPMQHGRPVRQPDAIAVFVTQSGTKTMAGDFLKDRVLTFGIRSLF